MLKTLRLLTASTQVQRCVDNARRWNAQCNALTDEISRDDALTWARRADARYAHGNARALEGVPVVVKANIATTELTTSCASSLLQEYISPFDATVVKLLKNAGAIILAKANMDEFGMGSFNNNSVHGPTVQMDARRVSGGSSGGSAVALQAGMCLAAIGSDTGGSVRLPASYCGLVGFKPSYGRISRYGLVPYANSLDTIGTFTTTVGDAALLYDVLAQQDSMDSTSIPTNTTRLKLNRKLIIGIPKEYNLKELSPLVRSLWSNAIERLEQHAELRQVSLPNTHAALAAYYVLAPTEASSNLARYDGIRYGSESNRSIGFSSEVQRRLIMGTFVLSSAFNSYYIQSQRIRRMVVEDFNKIFGESNSSTNEDKVDVVLTPTAISVAPMISQLIHVRDVDMYVNDAMTIPASLAGLPAITVPCTTSEGSVGMQMMAQHGNDNILLDAATLLEQCMITHS